MPPVRNVASTQLYWFSCFQKGTKNNLLGTAVLSNKFMRKKKMTWFLWFPKDFKFDKKINMDTSVLHENHNFKKIWTWAGLFVCLCGESYYEFSMSDSQHSHNLQIHNLQWLNLLNPFWSTNDPFFNCLNPRNLGAN